MTKVILGAVVAVLIALLGGWIWGASAKSTADRAVQSAELRIDLLEARSAVLGARLDLYSVNFGEASRHLEEAKALVQRAARRLQSRGADDRKRLDAASASIDEAQRLAGKLDQTANARAADAAKALDAALESAKQ